MGPEALVTFLFKAPPEVRNVELLGSWDNFKRRYRMHNDRRRGSGFWAGCFKFEDIIFDGVVPNLANPRSGGLKQGGVYWYYYLLNHDVEAYNSGLSTTTDCPLLPGQPVNIIEVPSEVWERPERRRSASFDVVGTLANMTSMTTLEPEDKFAKLDPPPVCKVHQRCVSDLALNGRLENNPPKDDSSLSTRAGAAEASFRPTSHGTTASKRRRVDRELKPRPDTAGSQRSHLSIQALSIFSSMTPRSRASRGPNESRHEHSRPITRHGQAQIPSFDFGFNRSSISDLDDEDYRNSSSRMGDLDSDFTPRVSIQRWSSSSTISSNSSGYYEEMEPLQAPNMNNVHFHGARPATRFDLPQRKASTAPGAQGHYAPRRPPSSIISPGLTSDDRSPTTDSGGFDDAIHSPALTISSAGAETPFFVSAMQSRAATASLDETDSYQESPSQHDESFNNYTVENLHPTSDQPERSYQNIDPTPAQPEPLPRAPVTNVTGTLSRNTSQSHFATYALPSSDTSSTSTSAKIPSPRSNSSFKAYSLRGPSTGHSGTDAAVVASATDVSLFLPAVAEQVREGASMTDTIFTELGYLGGSIS